MLSIGQNLVVALLGKDLGSYPCMSSLLLHQVELCCYIAHIGPSDSRKLRKGLKAHCCHTGPSCENDEGSSRF